MFLEIPSSIKNRGVYVAFILLFVSASVLAFDASALRVENTELAKEEPAEGTSPETAEELIQAGRGVYGSTCIFCHGPKGVGARGPSLVAGHWGPGGGNDDVYLRDVISNGRAGTIMGSFKESLTAAQIESVMRYLRFEAKQLAEK